MNRKRFTKPKPFKYFIHQTLFKFNNSIPNIFEKSKLIRLSDHKLSWTGWID